MSGKGSSPRPYSFTRKTFDNNWDRIFKKFTKQNKKVKDKQKLDL